MRYSFGYKIVLLLLLPKVIVVLAGCVCNVDTLYYKYNFAALELKHLESTKLKEGDNRLMINRNAYGIQIKLMAATSLAGTNPFSAFINTAYAFRKDCKYADYQPMDSIRSISITDLAGEGSGTGAGEDVTGKFRVYKGMYQTLDDYIEHFPYPNYNSMGRETVEVMEQLLLMEPPAAAGLHRFKVTVYLRSGGALEQTTESVYLQ